MDIIRLILEPKEKRTLNTASARRIPESKMVSTERKESFRIFETLFSRRQLIEMEVGMNGVYFEFERESVRNGTSFN